MVSTKKAAKAERATGKAASSADKPKPLTIAEQYAVLMRLLGTDYADVMREVCRNNLLQALIGGLGAVLGVVVLPKVLPALAGVTVTKDLVPWLGVLGGIVASIIGTFFTSPYEGYVKELAAIDDPAIQANILKDVYKIIQDAAAADEKQNAQEVQDLTIPNALDVAFFNNIKRYSIRFDVWKACMEHKKAANASASNKKQD